MYGAILGDIIGSPYEFDRGNKSKEFPLFIQKSEFTDDTVMTIAVAEALMKAGADSNEKKIKKDLIHSLKKWGKQYPYAGYGMMFIEWLMIPSPKPYGSFGNGSAMRVSAAAWLGKNLDQVRALARMTAEITHNHPEGIKGAEATAIAGSIAEGYYGVPEDLKQECITRIPDEMKEVLKMFTEMIN